MKVGNKTMFVRTDATFVKGRSEKKEFKNSKSQIRSKQRNKKALNKEGHFKREFLDRKKRFKDKDKENVSDEASMCKKDMRVLMLSL